MSLPLRRIGRELVKGCLRRCGPFINSVKGFDSRQACYLLSGV